MKKLKCKICGLISTNLTTHIPRIHHLTNKEYKIKFNVKTTQIFTSESLNKIQEGRKKSGVLSPYTLEFWKKQGFSIDDAKYQISIRRPSNINYWINKYGENLGKEKYKDFCNLKLKMQKKYGIKLAKEKYNKFKKKVAKNSNTKIEHWIKKGYSQEEASKKLKNRQATRSRKKSIEKYGEIEGNKKIDESNKKWINALYCGKSKEEIEKFNKSKASKNLQLLISKFGKKGIEKFINIVGYKNKKLIFQILELGDKKKLIANIRKMTNDDYFFIRKFLKGPISKYVFKIQNVNKILEQIFPEFIVKQINSHFKTILYKGVKYYSFGEYHIAKYLNENKIEFLYNKKYPIENRAFRYDFFIPKFQFYIEYCGLMGNEKYDKRLKIKKELLLKNNFEIIFSNNIKYIKKFIDEKRKNNKGNL